jgi:hypothetical protein
LEIIGSPDRLTDIKDPDFVLAGNTSTDSEELEDMDIHGLSPDDWEVIDKNGNVQIMKGPVRTHELTEEEKEALKAEEEKKDDEAIEAIRKNGDFRYLTAKRVLRFAPIMERGVSCSHLLSFDFTTKVPFRKFQPNSRGRASSKPVRQQLLNTKTRRNIRN